MADERAGGAVTEQPHEVLERAAERLEAAQQDIADSPVAVDVGSDSSGQFDVLQVGPEGVRHLVTWLRTDAEQWTIDTAGLSPERVLWIQRERYSGALGFARMVLGEAAQPSGRRHA